MEEEDNNNFNLLDFIKEAKFFLVELKTRWILISTFVLITSLLGLFYSVNSKPKYVAVSTLMLENSKSGGVMSGALALASQFGLMGGGASSVINEDKLMEIAKSQAILKSALLKKVTINSNNDFLANHFINLCGYRKLWENNDSLKNFEFVHSEENLSLQENTILKMFCMKMTQNVLSIEKSKSGIISITTKSPSELFSVYFNQLLLEALTSFYVDRINEKGQTNLKIIQKRVDSIAISLKDSENALAKWKDSNFQLVKAQGLMVEFDLRRNVEVNSSLYIEGVKQLEVSKFSLLQDTPFLQIIDRPTFPINPSGQISIIVGLTMGAFLGLFLSVVYIFVKKKYDSIMNQIKS